MCIYFSLVKLRLEQEIKLLGMFHVCVNCSYSAVLLYFHASDSKYMEGSGEYDPVLGPWKVYND